MDTTLGVVGDNRLRFYQDLHFEYDVNGNVTKRTRGNQKAGTQEVLDLTWNADHQLIESNATRHGVTQATRYAYAPLGRRVAKGDAFGSIHYLWDGDLMVHSQRGARQALYIYEPGSFVPLATIQGAGEEHSTYWYQCDQIGAPLELTDRVFDLIHGNLNTPESLRSRDFYLSLSQDQKDDFKYLAILAVDSAIFRVLRMTDQGMIDIKFNDSENIAQLSDGLAGELFGDNGWMKEFSTYPSTTM